jgi:hypothetical protein
MAQWIPPEDCFRHENVPYREGTHFANDSKGANWRARPSGRSPKVEDRGSLTWSVRPEQLDLREVTRYKNLQKPTGRTNISARHSDIR